jgi:hypothetical protein
MLAPDFYEGQPEGFDIYSWCPAPTPTVPATQVHMHVPTSLGTMLVRFKGPGTLDRLIAALIKHRVDVWGADDSPHAGQAMRERIARMFDAMVPWATIRAEEVAAACRAVETAEEAAGGATQRGAEDSDV